MMLHLYTISYISCHVKLSKAEPILYKIIETKHMTFLIVISTLVQNRFLASHLQRRSYEEPWLILLNSVGFNFNRRIKLF